MESQAEDSDSIFSLSVVTEFIAIKFYENDTI